MEKLIKGVHVFHERVFQERRLVYEKLAHGQKPETLFITCSDSRIVPNQLTQTGPGELFIIRNAGNIVPEYGVVGGGEDATIEYAIVALGVRDVVVCGHSHCGAMLALIDDKPLPPRLSAVGRWLKHAERTRERVTAKTTDGAPRLITAVEENVLVQIDHLRTHPAVREAEEAGAIRIHGWVYHIESGEVCVWNQSTQQFEPLVRQSERSAG